MAKKGKGPTKPTSVTSIAKPRAGRMSRRQALNRRANQEELRAKISAGEHHIHLSNDIEELQKLRRTLAKKKTMYREEQAAYMCKLAALKTTIDTRFRLLNKYLPDLRSVELTDSDGNNPLEKAAAAWAEALTAGVDDVKSGT